MPNASSPASAFSRRPARCRESSGASSPEKYASSTRPVFSRMSFALPSALSRSQSAPCGDLARRSRCRSACPVARSQTTVGLALVRDADRGEVAGRSPARQRLGRDAGLRGPDLGRVVLDPAGLRKDLAKFLLSDRLMLPASSKTIARELVVP